MGPLRRVHAPMNRSLDLPPGFTPMKMEEVGTADTDGRSSFPRSDSRYLPLEDHRHE